MRLRYESHEYGGRSKGVPCPVCSTLDEQKQPRPAVPVDAPRDLMHEIRLLLEMLVRAYDPCVSCSVHYLDVEFV